MNVISLRGEERKKFEAFAIALAMNVKTKPLSFTEADYTWKVMVSGGGPRDPDKSGEN